MAKSRSISRKKPQAKSMDYDFLRKEGIRYAQKFSGSIWTDYNEHDPGVTILEHLAFAITDLGYRTNFQIEDLLFARDQDTQKKAGSTFHDPFQILPSAPLTPMDYRKLIIDQIKGIENAWVVPDHSNINGWRGVLSVQLQLSGDPSSQETAEIIEAVWELLLANRNLCEDFGDVYVMNTEALLIEADIRVSPDADGEQTMARVLDQLQSLLSPPIPKYNQGGLQELGEDLCSIYDGPLPRNGFIRKTDLPAAPTSLNISNLRQVISQVEGIQSVTELTVRKDGVRIRGGEVAIKKNHYLVLDKLMLSEETQNYPIRFFRNGMEMKVDLYYVHLAQQSLNSAKREEYIPDLHFRSTQPTSRKFLKDIRQYISIQKLFPSIYGVGTYGFSRRTNNTQKAKAKQLKSYLLLFEVVLANYLSQLAGLKNYFSANLETHKSYYSQFPFDIPDVDLLLLPVKEGDKRMAIQEALDNIIADLDNEGDRHNRFLDHLLSRFGMQVSADLAKRILSLNPGSADPEHELVDVKQKMLGEVITLGKDRFKGYDYSKPSDRHDPTNISGLKKSLLTALGLKDHVHRLSSIREFAPLKVLYPTQEEKETKEEKLLPLRQMLALGIDSSRYFISPKGGEYRLYFRKNLEETRKGIPPIFRAKFGRKHEGKEKCETFRDQLIETLQSINEGSKGLYLIEHLLLRPVRTKRSKLVFTIPLPRFKTEIVFTSADLLDRDQWNAISNDLLIFASSSHNYTEELNKDGKGIEIHLHKRVEEKGEIYETLLISEPITDQGAEEGLSLDNIKENLAGAVGRIRDRNPRELDQLLETELQKFDSDNSDSRFYNQQVSLFLPAWPDTFQSGNDFRFFFEHLVQNKVPAHLKINIHWLGIKQMKAFEKLFEFWKNRRIQQTIVNRLCVKAKGQIPEKELKSDWEQLQETPLSEELALMRGSSRRKDKYNRLSNAMESALDEASYELYQFINGLQNPQLLEIVPSPEDEPK